MTSKRICEIGTINDETKSMLHQISNMRNEQVHPQKMAHDFVPVNGTSMIFKFRCGECNQLHESRIYESIVYAYTTYSNREPIPKWHCPKHPRAKVKKHGLLWLIAANVKLMMMELI
jgi:hypothetical protein